MNKMFFKEKILIIIMKTININYIKFKKMKIKIRIKKNLKQKILQFLDIKTNPF